MSQNNLRRACKKQHRVLSLSRAKQWAGAVVLAAALTLLTAPVQRPSVPLPQLETTPLQAAGGLQITVSPTLSPAFDPNISDYVVGYTDGSPVQVSVNAPRNTKVSIDGQAFQKLTFTQNVRLTPGQSFPIVVNSLAGSKTYYVRCLPTDFPTWTTERLGTPQSEYYVFAPNLSLTGATPRHYIVIADNYGVPIWWYRSTGVPNDAKLLPNGNMAWTLTTPSTGEERKLDGSLVHTFAADSSIGGTIDNHELLMLPNGHYVYIAAVTRGPVDLSAYGGSSSATVSDQVIEEFASDGSLVWSWSAMDHIPVSETGSQWQVPYLTTTSPADPYHMNAVEPDGDGFVVSLRHLNAVYRIDKASGNITWKLGGSARPESLAFVGDTYGNFSGQHDARILPDGTLTLHDNGTLKDITPGRAPRGVRYRLDTTAKTATLVEEVSDTAAPGSACCGSIRKQAGGDWVASWGANTFVTELAADGSRVLRLSFPSPYFSYRVVPVSSNMVSRTALRTGMDAQFPR